MWGECVSMYVSVCCVCVCLYSFTIKASSVCKMSGAYLRGTGQRSCVVFQVPSSLFLKMSYFTSKDETTARRQLERKRYVILLGEKMIYIDLGYKSATQRSRQVTKRY